MTSGVTTEQDRPFGLLLVDKPADITSHDVVDAARRAYRERSIGHLGTLDPFATGLLVLLVGRATRLATFIESEPKVYDVVIAFGMETDTDDLTGAPVRAAALPEPGAVTAAISALTGTITQIPPAFSAKKVAGAIAHRAARAGHPLELHPVTVTVHGWDNLSWHGPAALAATVTCSGGTYVRALARDLGRLAGSAAHAAALRRTAAGIFHVRDAVPLESLRTAPVPALRALRVVPD